MAHMNETESSLTINGIETSVVKLTRAQVRELDTGNDDLDGALDEMQAEAETVKAYVVIEIEPGEI